MKYTYRLYIGNDKYYTFRNWKVYIAMYCLIHDDRAMLRLFTFRLNECLKNKSLIKMFFNQNDTIETVKKKVNDLADKIKNNYLYI